MNKNLKAVKKNDFKTTLDMVEDTEPANLKETADKLNDYLANVYATFLKTQNYHWNVKGPHFYSLHKMLEEQYEQLYAMIDDLAERITSMGYEAKGSLADYKDSSEIIPAKDRSDTQGILKDLVQSQTKLVNFARQIIEDSSEHKDFATEDLVTSMLGEHEKMRWMLESSLES